MSSELPSKLRELPCGFRDLFNWLGEVLWCLHIDLSTSFAQLQCCMKLILGDGFPLTICIVLEHEILKVFAPESDLA